MKICRNEKTFYLGGYYLLNVLKNILFRRILFIELFTNVRCFGFYTFIRACELSNEM